MCPAVCECFVCVGIGVVSILSFVFQELPDYGGDTESDGGGNDSSVPNGRSSVSTAGDVGSLGRSSSSAAGGVASAAAERPWWAATSFQEGIPPVVEKRAQPKFQPVERVRGAMKVDAAVRVTFNKLEQHALQVAVHGKPQDGKDWCAHMHKDYGLTLQKELSNEAHPTLFLQLPQDPSGGNPPTDNIKYVKELCGRHRGEVVEVGRSTWKLHAQGPPPADTIHKQLLLGSEVGPASGGFQTSDIQTMAEFGAQVVFSNDSHRPDWKNMKSRWIAPDCKSTAHHWQRYCKVITRSMLFSGLGKHWSARALYDFYMAQRIVVLKIQRTGGPQRSTRQFLAQETNHIIPELCKALGLKVPENTASMKEYIASMTLAAFAPPVVKLPAHRAEARARHIPQQPVDDIAAQHAPGPIGQIAKESASSSYRGHKQSASGDWSSWVPFVAVRSTSHCSVNGWQSAVSLWGLCFALRPSAHNDTIVAVCAGWQAVEELVVSQMPCGPVDKWIPVQRFRHTGVGDVATCAKHDDQRQPPCAGGSGRTA